MRERAARVNRGLLLIELKLTALLLFELPLVTADTIRRHRD